MAGVSPLRALVLVVAFSIGLVACGAGAGPSADPPRSGSLTVAAPVPLDRLLPAPDVVPSLNLAAAVRLTGPDDAAGRLYSAVDPLLPGAIERMRRGGFSGGLLRDQRGVDPRRGLESMRTFVLRFRDRDAADAEVAAQWDELRRVPLPSEVVSVPGVPAARALRVERPAPLGSVAPGLILLWSEGRDVLGIQALALPGGSLFEDRIFAVVKDVHEAAAAREARARAGVAPADATLARYLPEPPFPVPGVTEEKTVDTIDAFAAASGWDPQDAPGYVDWLRDAGFSGAAYRTLAPNDADHPVQYVAMWVRRFADPRWAAEDVAGTIDAYRGIRTTGVVVRFRASTVAGLPAGQRARWEIHQGPSTRQHGYALAWHSGSDSYEIHVVANPGRNIDEGAVLRVARATVQPAGG